MGKNVGDDFRERKLTLPVIRAVAEADEAERAFWDRRLPKGTSDPAIWEEAMAILSRRGSLASTREVALRHAADAKAVLAQMPVGPLIEMLSDLSEFVVERRDLGRGCGPRQAPDRGAAPRTALPRKDGGRVMYPST